MNRRSFFNILGKAVLGTAIALNIPDVLIPTPKELNEIVASLVDDFFFMDTPFLAYLRTKTISMQI